MKILALQPAIDTPDRYNYLVNYSLWDSISKITEFKRLEFNAGISINWDWVDNTDVIFLPMNIRLKGHEKFISALKMTVKKNIPIIMFDNDDLRRKQNDPLYNGIDIIFSRMYNDNSRTWLPWCVDTEIFTPVYGGEFISMPASRTEPYKLRREIANKFKGQINLEQPTGKAYVKHLQRSKAVICTGSEECRVTRAKVLEAMACGAVVIAEMTEYLFNYTKTFFHLTDAEELPYIIGTINRHPDDIKEMQVYGRSTAEKHSAETQARKVVAYIESFLNRKPDKDILHSIQNPLN